LFDTIAKTSEVEAAKKIKISQSAPSLEELVVFVLGALLSESDANEVFFKRFKVEKFKESGGEFKIEGVAFGENEKPEFGGTVVKAVTFHELRVTKPDARSREWKIRVLLDV
jgi:SHS2 domain-containing protein